MKFSCEKYLLLNAVTTSSRAAAVKSAVAALEGLLLECRGNTVTISGYDLKTGIISSFPADIITEGSIILNARLFGEIVRKLPDEPVLISSEENLLTTISSGASQFDIMGSQAEDYPELPISENDQLITVKQGILKSMITQTNFAVSDNEARPIHTGTLFETENGILTMVAVDGYRLALRREPVEGVEGESLLLLLDDKGVAASSGSACTSGSLDPSHVLLAIGRPHEIAHGSMRLTLCEENTEEEVEQIIEAVRDVVAYLRSMSPVWRDLTSGKTPFILDP